MFPDRAARSIIACKIQKLQSFKHAGTTAADYPWSILNSYWKENGDTVIKYSG